MRPWMCQRRGERGARLNRLAQESGPHRSGAQVVTGSRKFHGQFLPGCFRIPRMSSLAHALVRLRWRGRILQEDPTKLRRGVRTSRASVMGMRSVTNASADSRRAENAGEEHTVQFKERDGSDQTGPTWRWEGKHRTVDWEPGEGVRLAHGARLSAWDAHDCRMGRMRGVGKLGRLSSIWPNEQSSVLFFLFLFLFYIFISHFNPMFDSEFQTCIRCIKQKSQHDNAGIFIYTDSFVHATKHIIQ